MERKGRLYCIILILAMCTGCQKNEVIGEYCIRFEERHYDVKALDPDEEQITDISLMVFDEDGKAEECIWQPSADTGIRLKLVKGRTYSFRACLNFGYRVYADEIGELDEIRYHMAYPDEYREGIPMYASADGIKAGEEVTIILKPVRLMSKISIRMDRSALSDDVDMNVRTVRIGNCPKSVQVFKPSKARSEDDCFASGFCRTENETAALNRTLSDGKSGEIHLYMLENMQGLFSESISTDKDKVFDEDDYRSRVCSYIELELDYMSDEKYSFGKGLIYRFYLGDSLNDLNVERNCHYRITVRPENDGLSDEGWRVDKSNLADQGPVWFKAYPQNYIRGDIGDKVHIWCEFSPKNAPFDVGEDYMEFDKETGIYDYEIDEDGHGAVLTLTGPGRGLITMLAGEPINDGVLFIIEVNLPL